MMKVIGNIKKLVTIRTFINIQLFKKKLHDQNLVLESCALIRLLSSAPVKRAYALVIIQVQQ